MIYTFGHSYSTRNILPRFIQKSLTFGHFYSTRNILPRFIKESPTFGHSTVLVIFYQDLYRKALFSRLVLVIHTVLEIVYQDLYRKALVLVNPTEIEIF